MIKYIFKEPVTLKGVTDINDPQIPQVIGEELARLEVELGGELTPERTVAAASDPSSPLHPHFEWDDQAAAEQYRLDQARGIIRSIRAVDDEGASRPAYLSIKQNGRTSYRSISTVLASHSLREKVLESAMRDLEAWRRRYQDIEDACSLVDSAVKKIKRRLAKEKENRPSA